MVCGTQRKAFSLVCAHRACRSIALLCILAGILQGISPPSSPIIPALVTELLRTFHQTSVTPQRTTRRSAPHKRKIIWSAYTIPKRHVEDVLFRHLPFNHGLNCRLHARKPSRRSLSGRYSTRLQRAERWRMCWRTV